MEPRRLILLRHAKSSWDNPGLRDFDRPLSGRGRRDAPRMGAYLVEQGIEPDRVLVSPSARTRETWELVAGVLGVDPEVEFAPDLYHGAPRGMLDLVREQDDGYRAVMLVAHNPGTEDLVNRLCGSGEPDALRRLASKYPTCGLAEIRVDCERWSHLSWGQGELLRFVVPRELAG